MAATAALTIFVPNANDCDCETTHLSGMGGIFVLVDVRSIQSWVAGFTNVVTAVTTRDDNIALLVKLCAIRFWL